MSRWPFRTRPGVGDDVVYETRSWWTRWLPNRLNLGWYAYANAASARNRHMVRLNEMMLKVDAELHRWAEAEAALAAEKDTSKGSKHNHLGISSVFPMDPKTISSMLPYVAEPEPKFKAYLNQSILKRILKQHNVGTSVSNNAAPASDNKSGNTYDMIVSTADTTAPGIYDNGAHVVQWRADQERNSSGSSQNKSGSNPTKEDWKRARKANPKRPDEDQGEWDKRVKQWLQSN